MSARAAPPGAPARRIPGGAPAPAAFPVLCALFAAVAFLGACSTDQFKAIEEDYTVVGGQPQVDPALPSVDRTDATAKAEDFASSSPVQVDAFVQKQVAKVDILWIIDNSGSMNEEQNKVKDNFQKFVDKLVETNTALDYHIGVVTTDTTSPAESGKLINKANLAKPWIGRDTCAAPCLPAAKFRENAFVGVSGSGDEKGLLAAMLALSKPLNAPNGPNWGFLRDDAALFIIILSDEEDSSCSPTFADRGGCGSPLGYGSTEYYARFLEGLKGFGRKEFVTFGAIVALSQDSLPTNPPLVGCRGVDNANNLAFYAPRYVDVARRTGGLATSICDANYVSALQNLGYLATGAKTTFLLTRAPYPAAIKVYVTRPGDTRRLMVANQDYFYRPCTGASNQTVFNAIEFSLNALPPASATIEVEYPVKVSGVACP